MYTLLFLRTGWSPLLLASTKGHKPLVQLFLDNNARVDVFDQEAKSALHLLSLIHISSPRD